MINNEPQVHLNLNVRGLGPSATLAINERSNQLLKEGREVFKLGLGQSPFPVPASVVEALKANAHQKDYLPVKGLEALRHEVAAYHSRKNFISRSGDEVLVGPGSKELMFLVQIVYYGDLVIPTPSWVSYAPQAEIIGRHIRWLRTRAEDHWKLQPDVLEELCKKDPDRPRLLILNYPNNPTGGTYSTEQLEQLAHVARKYRVILISDEIYGELNHEGTHRSIAEFYPEGTIISAGLSKWCGAGGWRLGTFSFPPNLRWLLDSMSVVASETFTSVSAPIQYAAIRAFAGGEDIEDYLADSRRILRLIGTTAVSILEDAGVEVAPAEGGFYLLPDFGRFREQFRQRGITTSEEMCERLLEETGVATLPGSHFGHTHDELTLRLAYVNFDGARALSSASAVPLTNELPSDFLENNCRSTIHAIERIAEWVGKKV